MYVHAQVDDRLGGAPANVACGLARLGTPVAFLGRLGEDDIGAWLGLAGGGGKGATLLSLCWFVGVGAFIGCAFLIPRHKLSGNSFREVFGTRGVNTQALQWDKVNLGGGNAYQSR